MIVLDTNVVSELMRPAPDPKVLAWLDAQASDALWLTSVNVAELLFGLTRLPDGARKRGLLASFANMLEVDFDRRVLAFDLRAATVFAEMAANRERAGKHVGLADGQIAAICLEQGATLATRNVRHFSDVGLALVNPWSGKA